MCRDENANNIFRTQPTPAEEKKEDFAKDVAADGKDEVGKFLLRCIFDVLELVFYSEFDILLLSFILTCFLVDETNGEYLKPNWD